MIVGKFWDKGPACHYIMEGEGSQKEGILAPIGNWPQSPGLHRRDRRVFYDSSAFSAYPAV